jgi:hypothetical protein
MVNHHGLCNNPAPTHCGGSSLIFVITAGSSLHLLKNNENQRTVGFGYLPKIRMKEPSGLGI